MFQPIFDREVSRILSRIILTREDEVISAAGARNRIERLPHRFVPIGQGRAVPVALNGAPCGFKPGHRNVYSVPRLQMREEMIDRRYLILDAFLFVEKDALFDRSPHARRLYSVRCYLVLRKLAFPMPTMLASTFRRICDEIESERRSK